MKAIICKCSHSPEAHSEAWDGYCAICGKDRCPRFVQHEHAFDKGATLIDGYGRRRQQCDDCGAVL